MCFFLGTTSYRGTVGSKQRRKDERQDLFEGPVSANELLGLTDVIAPPLN